MNWPMFISIAELLIGIVVRLLDIEPIQHVSRKRYYSYVAIIIIISLAITYFLSAFRSTISGPEPSSSPSAVMRAEQTTDNDPPLAETMSSAETPPAETPTPTVASTPGPWSEWTETRPVLDESIYEIVSIKQYRYEEEMKSYSENLPGWTRVYAETQYTDYGEWSEWGTQLYETTDTRQAEEKRQYSYSNKEENVFDAMVSGWLLDYSETYYGDYGGWSEWSDSQFYSNENREVETRTVVDRDEYTAYKYYHYSDGSFTHFCTYLHPGLTLGDTGWLDSPLSPVTLSDGSTRWAHDYPQPGHKNYYGCVCPRVSNWGGQFYSYNGSIYYWYETKQVPTTYKTQYRYRDRVQLTRYHCYRWTSWSPYTDTQFSETQSRQVQTRTVYRYREREKVMLYHYTHWTDWVAYEAIPIEEQNIESLQSRTIYRYRRR